MIKYLNTDITFREIPDEICLSINLTNCPFKCEGCHSPQLREDIGEELTSEKLNQLIKENPGITCVVFLGGDSDYKELEHLVFHYIRKSSNKYIKFAWYSGRTKIPDDINLALFSYIKLGPYIAEKGGLDNSNTNQKLYEIELIDKGDYNFAIELKDITYKFWKNEN